MKYQYKATLERVIDGDTIIAAIDLGFNVYTKQKLRLINVDTCELNSGDDANKQKAKEAKRFVNACLHGQEFLVETFRRKSGASIKTFDRYVANVTLQYNNETRSLSELLVEHGFNK